MCVDSLEWEIETNVSSLSDSLALSKQWAGSGSNLQQLLDLQFLHSAASNMRKGRWDHERMDWDSHVRQLLHEGKFGNEHLMSVSTHDKLVRILDPLLQCKEYNS